MMVYLAICVAKPITGYLLKKVPRIQKLRDKAFNIESMNASTVDLNHLPRKGLLGVLFEIVPPAPTRFLHVLFSLELVHCNLASMTV